MMSNSQSLQTAAPLLRAFACLAQAGVMRLKDVVRAIRNRRDVVSLAQFDDRMLADIGLNRNDVRSALAEPFWRDAGSILIARAGERGLSRGRRRGKPNSIAAPSIVPEPQRERSTIASH